jgi:hypothetical protein
MKDTEAQSNTTEGDAMSVVVIQRAVSLDPGAWNWAVGLPSYDLAQELRMRQAAAISQVLAEIANGR